MMGNRVLLLNRWACFVLFVGYLLVKSRRRNRKATVDIRSTRQGTWVVL
jgi:hypothetical protein